MKIGVISDTHLSIENSLLPENLIKGLEGCDLIIHAGDLVDLSVLEPLKKIAKVEAVCGNMDGHDVKCKLAEKKILNVQGKKICIMHGFGHPDKLVDILKKEFFQEKPDIIIFGHSHAPKNEYIEGVLFFNPGSVTDTVFAPYRSYGIIEIGNNGEIMPRIYKL